MIKRPIVDHYHHHSLAVVLVSEFVGVGVNVAVALSLIVLEAVPEFELVDVDEGDSLIVLALYGRT